MQATHELTTTLNHLLEICRDGENGFQSAANALSDPSLKAELMQYSMQRHDFCTDLASAIIRVGETPKERGTVSGAMHRGWMNLKSAVAGKNPHAIFAECERGEDSAVKAYRDALLQVGTPEMAMIESQLEQIQSVHDRIKMLRDTSAND